MAYVESRLPSTAKKKTSKGATKAVRKSSGLSGKPAAPSISSPSISSAASPKAGSPARRKARRTLLKKVRKVGDDFSKLSDKDVKAFEKLTSPERMEARAQKRAKKLWRDTKDISGLAGKVPSVEFGDRGVEERGHVGEASYTSDKILLANTLLGSPWKKAKRLGQDVLLHEFAHTGQGRAKGVPDTKREASRREGRAERFSKIGMRKLFKSGQKAPSYPKEVRRSHRHDPRRKIRYGQFKPGRLDKRERTDVTPWWETGAQRAKKPRESVTSLTAATHPVKKRKAQPKAKAPKKEPQPKKPRKVAVDVPEVVPEQYRKAVAKQGQRLNEAVAGTGMTGPEYLGKLIQFESGWSPTAENPSSAYGLGQFIDSTAQDFRERLNVETQDPKRPRQMIKGAAMHASGKHGYGALYAGYNPGYGSDPVPGTPGGENVKVKVSKRALKRTAGGSVPAAPKKVKGAYAGSQAVLHEVKKLLPGKEAVSARKEEGHAPTGDHDPSQPNAFANDLPAVGAQGAKLAADLAEKAGIKGYHTGDYTNWTSEKYPGYRFQILWDVPDHYDHVHIGVRWEGENLPPGTQLGGPISGTSASATSISGTAAGTAAAPAATAKKIKAKKMDGRKKSQLVRKLIAEGPAEVAVTEAVRSTTPYAERVKKAPIELGL